MSHSANSLRPILYALGANTAIAIAKLAAALYTSSTALLSEAVHSFADCGNQALLLIGLQSAKRPPTPDHPLGYGKAIYFWSFIVALMLFSMGGLFSVNQGIQKLYTHEGLHSPWLAVLILLFSVAMEILSLRGCLEEINTVRGDRTLWRWFRETRQSELIVVLCEDIAALVGLAFALVAVVLTLITHNPYYDAAGSIAIGVLLLIVALGIGIQIYALLIGQSVEPRTRQAIHDYLEQREEVVRIFNILTLHLGEDIMLAIKAEMRETHSSMDMIRDINSCEAGLRNAFPTVRWIFFEPDIED